MHPDRTAPVAFIGVVLPVEEERFAPPELRVDDHTQMSEKSVVDVDFKAGRAIDEFSHLVSLSSYPFDFDTASLICSRKAVITVACSGSRPRATAIMR